MPKLTFSGLEVVAELVNQQAHGNAVIIGEDDNGRGKGAQAVKARLLAPQVFADMLLSQYGAGVCSMEMTYTYAGDTVTLLTPSHRPLVFLNTRAMVFTVKHHGSIAYRGMVISGRENGADSYVEPRYCNGRATNTTSADY